MQELRVQLQIQCDQPQTNLSILKQYVDQIIRVNPQLQNSYCQKINLDSLELDGHVLNFATESSTMSELLSVHLGVIQKDLQNLGFTKITLQTIEIQPNNDILAKRQEIIKNLQKIREVTTPNSTAPVT